MKLPNVWGILRKFKDFCEFRGWKTSDNYDWVEINAEYHNFLSARSIHPSSFRRIATNRKCVVREGMSYRVVDAAYTAWLFSKTPSKTLVKMILDDPDFNGKTAVYDLSLLLKGEKLCVKLNNTDSTVFQEFENFLKDELEVKLKSLPNSGLHSKKHTVASLA